MPYYLMRHGTGLRSTHVVIVNLVRLIIETGVLTGRPYPIPRSGLGYQTYPFGSHLRDPPSMPLLFRHAVILGPRNRHLQDIRQHHARHFE